MKDWATNRLDFYNLHICIAKDKYAYFIYIFHILVSFYGQKKKPSLSYLQPSTSLNSQVAMKLKRKEWRPGQEIVKQGDVGDFSNGMGGIRWGWLGW